MRKWLIAGAAMMGMAVPALSLPGRREPPQAHAPKPFDGALSVLTYNVKGLPWPVATGRSDALGKIGDRLARLHAAGRAPAVVAMQEVFSADAARMIEATGYAYVATGPSASETSADDGGPTGRRFALTGSWLKGEGVGKAVGSGLVIMSDYPIVRVSKAAFPAFACAGYDCLANKGMLLATIALPDGSAVDVLTAHLNSRHASGASDARSFFAYRAQVATLERFVRSERDPAHPLVVAGDFNVGRASDRAAVLWGAVAGWSGPIGARDALGTLAAAGSPLSVDADWSRRRRKDWQFFDAGRSERLGVEKIDVPFGRDPSGAMLSDHVGYTATYRIGNVLRSVATIPSRAKAKASEA